MSRSSVPACLATLLLLSSTLSGANPAPADARSDLGQFLADRGILVSWDAAGGYANNVYLTPSDEEADLFFNARLRGEWRKARSDAESLYVNATIERRQYLSESDASELFWDLLANYDHDLDPFTLGFSGIAGYENYRTFDEEGGVLPAGEYESLGSTVRGFVAAAWTDAHSIEAGATYRVKRYVEDDLNYNEIGADLSYRWHISDIVSARAVIEARSQDYADYQALRVSDAADGSEPALDRDIRIVRVEARRDIGRHGYCRLFAESRASEENFEQEGDYSETALGIDTSFQVWRVFAIHGDLRIASRDYDNRLTPAGATQEDDFVSLEASIERALAGTVSVLLSAELSTKESNDSTDEYSEGAVSLGFRGIL